MTDATETEASDTRDDGLPRLVDLWSLALGGAEAVAQPLVLGTTKAAEAKLLLGLDSAETTVMPRPDGFVDACFSHTFAQFDPAGRLSGVGFGDYHTGRRVPGAIEAAVARLNALGEPARDAEVRIGPNVAMRYHGCRAHQFATLPRFIQINRDIQGFTLSSWPEDKTISLRRDTPHAAILATFALAAFKTEYTEHFQLDYCLSWLAVFTQASLTSLVGAAPPLAN